MIAKSKGIVLSVHARRIFPRAENAFGSEGYNTNEKHTRAHKLFIALETAFGAKERTTGRINDPFEAPRRSLIIYNSCGISTISLRSHIVLPGYSYTRSHHAPPTSVAVSSLFSRNTRWDSAKVLIRYLQAAWRGSTRDRKGAGTVIKIISRRDVLLPAPCVATHLFWRVLYSVPVRTSGERACVIAAFFNHGRHLRAC